MEVPRRLLEELTAILKPLTDEDNGKNVEMNVLYTATELDEDAWAVDAAGELPPALAKSLIDHPWVYVLGLRDGRVIHFSGACVHPGGKWVGLSVHELNNNMPMSGIKHSFGRGIDVRLSDIMWVADAPDGS